MGYEYNKKKLRKGHATADERRWTHIEIHKITEKAKKENI